VGTSIRTMTPAPINLRTGLRRGFRPTNARKLACVWRNLAAPRTNKSKLLLSHALARNFLAAPQVITKTTMGRTLLYKLVALGEFPRPITLGRNCRPVAWRRSEVDQQGFAAVADRKPATDCRATAQQPPEDRSVERQGRPVGYKVGAGAEPTRQDPLRGDPDLLSLKQIPATSAEHPGGKQAPVPAARDLGKSFPVGGSILEGH
jgi:predicted DNA-binding transcriptional regulator AlpA